MSFVLQVASERVELRFDPARRLLIIDKLELALRPQDRPEVRLFVDGSVAEFVISQQITLTVRFYYAGETAPDVHVTATGSRVVLEGWSIARISSDRLTNVATT